MKTIEEKAKAYDEAIKRGLDYIRHTPATEMVTRQDIFEAIFPEFKEPKDEKIRKGIIELVRQSSKILDKQNQKDMLDWLEKQGEQKPNPYSGTSFEYNGHIWGMCARDNGVDILLDKQLFKHLEKQGEELVEPKWCHHKVDLSNCSEEYRKAYYDGWNNCNMQYSQCESEKSDVLKCLINGMKFYYDGNEEATWGTEKFSMKAKDILSWLEKQGEKFTAIDVDKMVMEYSHTEDGDFGLPKTCMIMAYRKGIEDVLKLLKQGEKTLNADKVVEWIYKYWPLCWGNFTLQVDDAIYKFKKDFGL